MLVNEKLLGMGTNFWLFVSDLFHQILFYFGGVVAMGILLVEKLRDKPIQWKWVFSFFMSCLFVSCYQAWLDEHHNSDRLIQEKREISELASFWQRQSVAKDEALRSRDALVLQGLSTLGITQQTANETQRSLTNLSAKVFDLTKPEPTRITSSGVELKTLNLGTNRLGIFVAYINRRIPRFEGTITCGTPFVAQEMAMPVGLETITFTPPQVLRISQEVTFAGASWDPGQPIIAILIGDKLSISGCSLKQQ